MNFSVTWVNEAFLDYVLMKIQQRSNFKFLTGFENLNLLKSWILSQWLSIKRTFCLFFGGQETHFLES